MYIDKEDMCHIEFNEQEIMQRLSDWLQAIIDSMFDSEKANVPDFSLMDLGIALAAIRREWGIEYDYKGEIERLNKEYPEEEKEDGKH